MPNPPSSRTAYVFSPKRLSSRRAKSARMIRATTPISGEELAPRPITAEAPMERKSLAERRMRRQRSLANTAAVVELGENLKKKGLRRTQSWDPRASSSEAMPNNQQPSLRRLGTGGKFFHAMDHSGNKDSFESSYSFWSSKPALAMLCCLGLTVTCQNTKFLYGAALVFMYEVTLVLGNWRRFLVNHPIVQEFSEFTLEWFHYSSRQVERFCDRKDRSRKAALGLFQLYYPTTTEYVGDYIRQRRAEVTDIALAETERMQRRLGKTI